MPTDFTMPKLGLTMEEGTIVEWLVADGETVEDGRAVLVIQTDKVETEVNVVGGGRLRQVAAIGDTLPCGEVVGVLLGADEDAPPTTPAEAAPEAAANVAAAAPSVSPDRAPAATAGDTDAGRQFVSPNARRVAAEVGVDVAAVRGTGPGGRVVSEDVEAVAARTPSAAPATRPAVSPTLAAAPTGIVPATSAARTLADLLGVDVATVSTDAGDRRVTRDDVARHVRNLLAGASTGPAPAAATQPPSKVVAMRGMRGTIAKRMHQSLQEMAQLTLTMDADVDAVVADRRIRKEQGTAPGVTDYVIAAVARALRDHPHVNAQITPEGVAHLPGIHVGLAVALPGGLVVPVVRDADLRSLTELARETSRLATAAREGKLTLEEVEGGTFSVSALGMYGVDAFTPVINPPNVAILGVGRLREDLALGPTGITTVTRLTLSLTWDHRAFDGAPAAEFAQSVVTHLNDRSSAGSPRL